MLTPQLMNCLRSVRRCDLVGVGVTLLEECGLFGGVPRGARLGADVKPSYCLALLAAYRTDYKALSCFSITYLSASFPGDHRSTFSLKAGPNKCSSFIRVALPMMSLPSNRTVMIR